MATFSIELDSKGGWQVRIADDRGEAHFVGGFKTRSEAQEWLDERQRSPRKEP
jgi:hypothetical protein